MNTQTRKSKVLFVVITLTMLSIVISACSFHTGIPGGISQVVDITLDEEMFNQTEPTFKVHNQNIWEGLLEDVDHLELHDGYMRYLGTHTQPDGSRVAGSIDMSLEAMNGTLVARIIDMDIPGIDLNDPIVVEINQDLEMELSHMDFNHDHEMEPWHMNFDHDLDVYFQQVTVTENALQMKIKVDVEF